MVPFFLLKNLTNVIINEEYRILVTPDWSDSGQTLCLYSLAS